MSPPASTGWRVDTTTDALVLESGTIVALGWLDKLLGALDADPRHGLASPSTNQAWNPLGVAPNARGDNADIARTAAAADQRFGKTWRSFVSLSSVGEFCLAVGRAVMDAVGLSNWDARMDISA